MIENLAGKVVVITGGASGIGKGMAEAFADAGARLVLADTNETRLREVAEQLAESAEVLTRVVDVRRWSDIQRLADHVYGTFGAVHVLCNNAGVACTGLLWEHSEEDWEWIFGTNVRSVTSAIRCFVPRMLEQGEAGHIVNTSSMLGLSSSPVLGLYGASKQAVVGLSESLHMELILTGGNIGVSVLCPGPVKTNAAEEPGRPAGGAAKAALPPQLAEVEKFIKQAVNEGMSPREVGASVVKAVREGWFWVLPDPDLSNAEQRLSELQVAVEKQT